MLFKALEQTLFAETDGVKFSKQLQKMIKTYAITERESVIAALINYAKAGRILHWRAFLVADLIKLIQPQETQYAPFFEWAITEPALAYWSVDGLLKAAGKAAYAPLVALICSDSCELELRAKAIKSIAIYSKQHFDRGLPTDPSYWKVTDLRIHEILTWQQNAYVDGVEYAAPQTHISLKNPQTDFEKTLAKLDKKLEKQRALQQDLANPRDYLVIANSADIADIQARWSLPVLYLEFLKNYSPLRVTIQHQRFIEGFNFYGAHELLKAQAGYAYRANTNAVSEDWPQNLVLIGDDAGDPYCIDLGNIRHGDAPIYSAEHGVGKWNFELVAPSFVAFVKMLVGRR